MWYNARMKRDKTTNGKIGFIALAVAGVLCGCRGTTPVATGEAARFTVGAASSMETVRPRAGAKVAPATAFAVRLAQGERESFQVLVTAPQDLKDVRVAVTDGKRAGGGVFAAGNVACRVTGYVETKTTPPYLAKLPGGATPGWWPDPILDFLDRADVKAGDVQSFWVRVTCPRGQKAGVYAAALTVSAAGVPSQTFPFTVRVNGFAVPKTSPLPLAVTFSPMVHSSLGDRDEPPPDEKKLFDEIEADPDSPVNAWRRHRAAWGDFLADYYLMPDSLYWGEKGRPYFDLLARLKEQGRLGNFNLGYWSYPKTNTAEAVAAWRESTLPRLREAYDEAKRLGILDRAYLYGCDEIPEKDFPMIRLAAETLKREFPGVPLSTTAYDDTYGEKTVLNLLDAFTPLTPKFDPAKAAAARARGREVWWYICCGPHTPYANMFIESPAIEGRLLMGAMTARCRPDGFLYYETSIWNSRKPIAGGPFTDWTARSWNVYNGDGAWLCVGPDGTPLATQRLENFRDGLEDFAYVKLLEARLLAADPMTPWARRARRALAVPCEVMKDLTHYTRDPKVLSAWRDELADLIEQEECK